MPRLRLWHRTKWHTIRPNPGQGYDLSGLLCYSVELLQQFFSNTSQHKNIYWLYRNTNIIWTAKRREIWTHLCFQLTHFVSIKQTLHKRPWLYLEEGFVVREWSCWYLCNEHLLLSLDLLLLPCGHLLQLRQRELHTLAAHLHTNTGTGQYTEIFPTTLDVEPLRLMINNEFNEGFPL